MLRRLARRFVEWFPAALARLGVVERTRATEAFDLAAPVMVTGGLRVFLRMADFLFVGLAIGDAAIAGLEIGFQYYFIGFGLSLALSSGTISVVSRLQGAGDRARAGLAVKQSLWIALLIALPLTAVSWLYARPLVDLLIDDPETIRYGAVYLKIVMLALTFRFWGMIAARALAGSGDTRTPMYVRLLTLPTNVVLNAILVFGLGPAPRLGVAGAAIGTAAANALAAAVFAAIFLSGDYAIAIPVRGRQFDREIVGELVRVSSPLGGMRLLQGFSYFPLIWVLGVLGPAAVSAYAIGRRVVFMAMMPAWGFSTAASTLVGQALGAGDERGAAAYGWQTFRLALATQLLIAAVLVVAARPIAIAFGTAHVDLTVDFIRVYGIATGGFSVSRTMRGSLRGAGDTRWPLYGTILGSYVVRLPLALLALPPTTTIAVPLLGISIAPGLGMGPLAVYLALLGDLYVKAAVNAGRFWSGRWKAVARRARVGAGASD